MADAALEIGTAITSRVTTLPLAAASVSVIVLAAGIDYQTLTRTRRIYQPLSSGAV
jgi:hypothetical protein